MITVSFFRDSEHQIVGFRSEGHAEYADFGSDIICAAVSALTLNAVNSVEAFTEDSFEGDSDGDAGRLIFRFTSRVSSESRLLMDSLLLGLQSIVDSYGEEYIKIRFEEV